MQLVARIAAFVLLGLTAATVAASVKSRLQPLIEQPALSAVVVSPDGSTLAMGLRAQDKDFLARLDLTKPGARPVMLGHMAESSVYELWWKGNDVILAQLVVGNLFFGDFQSFDLTAKKINKFPTLNRNYYVALHHLLENDPDHVVVGAGDLRKLNVRTGAVSVVERRAAQTSRWLVDDQGNARGATGDIDEKAFFLWRAQPGGKWERRELGRADRPDMQVFRVHPDDRRFIAADRTGTGPAPMVALDPAGMRTETIFSHPEVEADRLLPFGGNWRRIRAIQYETDTVRYHFLDPEAAALQAGVDSALPHRVNAIKSMSADGNLVVVHSRSDRDPGSYHLFNRSSGKVRFLGPEYPTVDPQQQQPSKRFSFKNRHGETLHGRYILPANTGAKPALFVLTGPWLVGPRARFEYDAWAQVFAAQGYATVRIDTRGTSGYGRQFEEAGAFGLDRALPEDIEDGVAHLIDSGLVDGDRVGLFSQTWGGVVGLQTVVGSERFKIWVNWAGPLDLRKVRYDALSLWTRDEKATVSEMGGRRAAARYVKSLDPLKIAATLNIPTFHYYPHNAETEFSDYVKLQSILKKTGQPAKFVRGAEVRKIEDINTAYYQAADDLFTFLETTFPATRK